MRRLSNLFRAGTTLAGICLTATLMQAHDRGRELLILTSTNNTANDVVVFGLNTAATPSLSLVTMLPTGGAGGASGNAGAVQFRDGFGAVANYGSNNVTQLVRDDNFIHVAGTIKLAPGCTGTLSVGLSAKDLFVAGANCAESHKWPSGNHESSVVALPDNSAAQIAVGQSWAAVTLKSGNGSVLQLPLTNAGDLN